VGTAKNILLFRQNENWDEIKVRIKQDLEKSAQRKHSLEEFDLFSGSSKPLVQINGYNDYGFLFNVDDAVMGSVIVFRDGFFSWNVKTFEEITIESLTPIWLHHPLPNLLLVGCGDRVQWFKSEIVEYLLKKGVIVEMLRTPTAASTFNILNQEERLVAAALITMKPYDSSVTPAETFSNMLKSS
jgi:NADH dehydrogenase [ubiquinone] 1 alpha subcomplex assembly factor 3